MKKVLIITYYWPPSGGAGVQRWLKFAKYLPEYGWQPVILTVDKKYASYPQLDESLEKEIGANCLVYTTKSFELYNLYKIIARKKEVPYGGFANETNESLPQRISKFIRGNLFLPDPRKGWNKYAVRKAIELIKLHNIETVVTTSPPHSTQLIGLELKKKLDIRWIADLRDPWTDIYYYHQFRHTAPALLIDKNYERKVVENADVLVTVSEGVKRVFAQKSKHAIDEKIAVVPNGFDEDDFEAVDVARGPKKVITYTGTISETYDVDNLILALEGVDEQLKSELLIRFVGKVPQPIVDKFKKARLEIELTGYVDHKTSIGYLLRADLLLLIIPKIKGNQGIITGKFFEYLASGKPVLAVGPTDGDLARLMDETRCGRLFGYDDTVGMRSFIIEKLMVSGSSTISEAAKQYSRKELTRRVAGLFSRTNNS